jgi:hypothetical protein
MVSKTRFGGLIMPTIYHTEQDRTLEMAAEHLYDNYKNDKVQDRILKVLGIYNQIVMRNGGKMFWKYCIKKYTKT